MKVLIVTAAFAPRIGGVESSVRGLAEQLASVEGVEVTVATDIPASGLDDASLRCRIVRRPGLAGLWKLIGAADVIHLAGPLLLPLLMAWLRAKAAVIRHHAYQACCPNGLLFHEPTKTMCPGHFARRRYHRCLGCNAASAGWGGSARMLLLTFPRRWLCRRAAANVHITHFVKNRLGLPGSQVIHYGIGDGDAGVAGGERPGGGGGTGSESLPPAPGAPVCFAYVGRLVREKGLAVLVDAAARLRDQGERFQLKLIGDGPEQPRLMGMVSARGLAGHVTFIGFLDGRPLRHALAGVRAVVMPSIWEETAGLSALEQMRREGVVIASDIGGLGELVGDAGLKFPPGDVEALVGCMKGVLRDPELVVRLGRAARARVGELCDPEVTLRSHLAVLDGAVAGRREPIARERSR